MARLNSKYSWELLYGNPVKDHSYWLDRNTGLISLKDESGDFPDQTDDGVLWLDTTRPLATFGEGKRAYVSIPLIDGDGNKTSALTTILKGLRLANRFHLSFCFNGLFNDESRSSLILAKRDHEDLMVKFS